MPKLDIGFSSLSGDDMDYFTPQIVTNADANAKFASLHNPTA